MILVHKNKCVFEGLLFHAGKPFIRDCHPLSRRVAVSKFILDTGKWPPVLAPCLTGHGKAGLVSCP